MSWVLLAPFKTADIMCTDEGFTYCDNAFYGRGVQLDIEANRWNTISKEGSPRVARDCNTSKEEAKDE